MYCPQCATANAGEVKFCRSCGTPLEAVALAISGKPAKDGKKKKLKTRDDWIEKRIDGVSCITRGGILLFVSLLLAIPMGLFLPISFGVPWIMVWFGLFGWMAIWGGIELANGISGVFEAESRLRLMTASGNDSHINAHQNLPSGEQLQLGEHKSISPPSVTEVTTRQLND
jgi:hypothetical protein